MTFGNIDSIETSTGLLGLRYLSSSTFEQDDMAIIPIETIKTAQKEFVIKNLYFMIIQVLFVQLKTNSKSAIKA